MLCKPIFFAALRRSLHRLMPETIISMGFRGLQAFGPPDSNGILTLSSRSGQDSIYPLDWQVHQDIVMSGTSRYRNIVDNRYGYNYIYMCDDNSI